MTFSPDILLKPAPWKEELSRPVLLELCNGRDATVGDVSTGAEREEGGKELVYLESMTPEIKENQKVLCSELTVGIRG